MATCLLVTNFNGSLAGTDGGGAFNWVNANGAINYSNDPVSGTLRLTLQAGATVRTTSGADHIRTASGMVVMRVTQTTDTPSGMWFNAGNYNGGKAWIDMYAGGSNDLNSRFIEDGNNSPATIGSDPPTDTPTLIWMEWTATQHRVGILGGATSSWVNRAVAAQTLDDAWGMTVGGRGDGTGETMTDGYMGPLAIYDAGLTSGELALLNAADLWTLTTHAPPPSGSSRIATQFQLRPY